MKRSLTRLPFAIAVFALTHLLSGCSNLSSGSDTSAESHCSQLLYDANIAINNKQYQSAINTSNTVLASCPIKDGMMTTDAKDAYYYAGLSYYSLQQYQPAADAFAKLMAFKNANPYLQRPATMYYNISMARLNPAKAQDYINQALPISDSKSNVDVLDAIYDVGTRDKSLMNNYMALIDNPKFPLRYADRFDRPIKLAQSLGDKKLAQTLTTRQATIEHVEAEARARNIAGPGVESSAGGDANLAGYKRGAFLSEAYRKAGEPVLAAYYEGVKKQYQGFLKSDAESAQADATLAKSNAEFEAQQRDQTQDLVNTVTGAVVSAGVASASGGNVAQAVNNSLADSAVSMSDNPEMMGAVKSGMQSFSSNQEKCTYATPSRFKQCCKNVIKGIFSSTQNSDGTTTYGCEHPDKYRTREGCTYNGDKLVINSCVING
ncbi:tol-pal system YbgF family protein [Lelliottia sp. RWM.1]|uniref:tetratricopeptide repeat protein n=1 Tax=Lelliottia sp. RWM.1 TaxID=2663242 RepID=UPI00193CE3BB|nr:hypothetical protein [Lelliottia sp. RWM.1]MBM3069841.1 hypothetical protein [Lelliottia sp. RWM.1]